MGLKTFNAIPSCTVNPTANNHLTRRQYVTGASCRPILVWSGSALTLPNSSWYDGVGMYYFHAQTGGSRAVFNQLIMSADWARNGEMFTDQIFNGRNIIIDQGTLRMRNGSSNETSGWRILNIYRVPFY